MNGKIEILATPGTDGCLLRSDSDCIVLQVLHAPVQLLVNAFLPEAGAVVPALRADRVALGAEASPTPPADVAPPAPVLAVPSAIKPSAPVTIPATGMTLIGYVEHNGDSVAPHGTYLGDPASVNRIEGFQVMWPDRPAGVDLSYGVAIEGQARGPLVATGKFCGTRNKVKRIIEVTFTLVGPNAHQYQLEGNACFSGGFRTSVQSGTALSGPSGMEHLTALALRAFPVTSTAHGKALAPAPTPTLGKHHGKKK